MIKTAAELKAYFNESVKPSKEQFADLIDSMVLRSKQTYQTITGNGAIVVPAYGETWVKLTKGSAAAITIPVPTTEQDGVVIHVYGPAYAHVITQSTDGFDAKGSSGTATSATPFTGILTLVANAGHWYTQASPLWTIA